MRTKNALIGMTATLTVGVLLGIMLFPLRKKGSRKGIAQKGRDLADALDERIDQRFNDFEKRMNEVVKKLTTEVGGVASESLAR
ncbi:MAG: hypothetical protein MUC73_01625 [Cyclobacteriaceae bacterium]|jgi:gas vesicle protein|nr:hypothetical protein [Cyclobacteriaceae bacterium]